MIDLRQKEKDEAHAQIKETEEYIAKITADRKDENEKFIEAMKADMEAIKVVRSAKEVLKMYYEKNKIEMGPIQGSVKMLQEPEFDIDQDQAPDATFSNKAAANFNRRGLFRSWITSLRTCRTKLWQIRKMRQRASKITKMKWRQRPNSKKTWNPKWQASR